MFEREFEYEHKKYGTVPVSISERYNEILKADEMHVWAIYYKGEEENHECFEYLKEDELTDKDIEKKLNKLIK